MLVSMLFQILPITVFAAMNPPTIVSIGEIAVDQETNMGGAPTVIKGQAYSAQVVATGAELTYTAGVGSYMTLPAGLTINSETGLISGNCTAENGRYNVYIEVSNSAGKTQGQRRKLQRKDGCGAHKRVLPPHGKSDGNA